MCTSSFSTQTIFPDAETDIFSSVSTISLWHIYFMEIAGQHFWRLTGMLEVLSIPSHPENIRLSTSLSLNVCLESTSLSSSGLSHHIYPELYSGFFWLLGGVTAKGEKGEGKK